MPHAILWFIGTPPERSDPSPPALAAQPHLELPHFNTEWEVLYGEWEVLYTNCFRTVYAAALCKRAAAPGENISGPMVTPVSSMILGSEAAL